MPIWMGVLLAVLVVSILASVLAVKLMECGCLGDEPLGEHRQ